MNKKIILFGLIVFIALFAMSYVSATVVIELDEDYDDDFGVPNIKVSDTENKILKDGKAITKNVKINKEIKTYGKTKKINIECSKKLTKKNIKNGKMGGQYEKNMNKARKVLTDCKIKSIKFKTAYKKLRAPDNLVHKVKIYKATIKYQPAVYKTVTKTTKATITLDEDDYATIKYINPFNGKKTTKYGSILCHY